MTRPSTRTAGELRPIQITRQHTAYAEGSVLITWGNTHVICTASVMDGVPRFLKGKGQGWITAEYAMLPRATHQRTDREATKGRQGGRTLEIQRLIGRALRACVDLKTLGDVTITIDCDVIQADGGTRVAAITGACVALHDALQWLVKRKKMKKTPEFTFIAGVSAGMYQGKPILDLEYAEDVVAETDMNIIMNEHGEFIEIQGTAEAKAFSQTELTDMLSLATTGLTEIIEKQKASGTLA